MPTLFDTYKEACNFPGKLDTPAVETALQKYLSALGIKREIRQLKAGWNLDCEPALKKSVMAILRDFEKRSGRNISAALAALATLATRDASDASD
jgi:hypothetical protein